MALLVHCFQVKLEFGVLIFVEGRKDPEKNSLSKEKNQQETQPTCDAILGHSSGRRVLSPLCHSFSPSLALFVYFQFFSSYILTTRFGNSRKALGFSVTRSMPIACK